MSERRALAGLLGLGLGLRLWIAFTNRGVTYDIDSIEMVGRLLSSHPLHVYDAGTYAQPRWPYPGGFLPVIALAHAIASGLHVPLWAVVKIPTVIADTAIAGVLWSGLGRLGAPAGQRWAATALVALGPSMILISAFHGQIDASAILPALIAVVLWQLDAPRRALAAGVLIGIGASIKTVPLFMVLALLPTARDRREATALVIVAVAIPAASVLPFVIADGHRTLHALTANKGIPGWGGLSVHVQPALVHVWLNHEPVTLSGLTRFLFDAQNAIVALAALAAGAYARYRRMDAVPAAALVWLAVYVANPDMAFQYFVWGIPFFLLAGYTLAVAGLQLALLLAAAELYLKFAVPRLEFLYAPLMDLVWLGLAIAVVLAVAPRRRAAAPG